MEKSPGGVGGGPASRGPVGPGFRDLLARIESHLGRAVELLGAGEPPRAFYGTDEVAKLLGRETFTVREWARLGRIRAVKRPSGRGRSRAWAVSRQEVDRIRDQGLLPPPGESPGRSGSRSAAGATEDMGGTADSDWRPDDARK